MFRNGFIDAKYRPATWWEKKDGTKVKASFTIDDLLIEGVGKCPDTALKLVIGKSKCKNRYRNSDARLEQRISRQTCGSATSISTTPTRRSLPSVSSSPALRSASKGLRTSPTMFLRRDSYRPSTVPLYTGRAHVVNGSANSPLLMRSWWLARASARKSPCAL